MLDQYDVPQTFSQTPLSPQEFISRMRQEVLGEENVLASEQRFDPPPKDDVGPFVRWVLSGKSVAFRNRYRII